MNTPSPISESGLRARWLMAILWVAIVIKCWAVTWAVGHWRMPFHAAWVVGPTIAFALLATGLWLAHRE